MDSQGDGSSQPDTISIASRTSQNTVDSDKVGQCPFLPSPKTSCWHNHPCRGTPRGVFPTLEPDLQSWLSLCRAGGGMSHVEILSEGTETWAVSQTARAVSLAEVVRVESESLGSPLLLSCPVWAARAALPSGRLELRVLRPRWFPETLVAVTGC